MGCLGRPTPPPGGRAGSENDTLLPMTMTCDWLKFWNGPAWRSKIIIRKPWRRKKKIKINSDKTIRHSRRGMPNNRPISLLPAFSKVLKKVIFNRMMTYLNSQNLSYGFRPKHGTIHSILHLLNSCAENNNKHPKVFCDLSKTFDVLSHDIMLNN